MRPQPPAYLIDPLAPITFKPDADLERWTRETFIEEGAAFENEAHAHLREATIGMVWTNAVAKRQGRTFLGQCELIGDNASTWQKARGLHLIRTWFDGMPDFLITLYAPWCAEASDRQFMALVSHELHHASQARDEYGQPKFDRNTGNPTFTIKGHDFEEHLAVVEQFGATSQALRMAAESIMTGPLISDEEIEIVCGSCLTR